MSKATDKIYTPRFSFLLGLVWIERCFTLALRG